MTRAAQFYAVLACLLPGAAPRRALGALGTDSPTALGDLGAVWITALDGGESRTPLEGWRADPRQPAVLRFEGLASPAAGSQPNSAPGLVLELLRGERLAGTLNSAGGERLSLSVAAGVILPAAIEDLRVLWGPAVEQARALEALVAPEHGDRLHVWVAPPPGAVGAGAVDRVDGTLIGFEPSGVTFEGAAGERAYPWSAVAALWVEALGAPPQASGFRAIGELAGGSRLYGEPLRLDAAGLELARSGGVATIPLAVIEELWLLGDPRADGPALLPLSELEPSSAEPCRPFGDDLGMTWPPRADLSATGTVLSAGGRRWRRGLGMHAPSRMSFALDGRWTGIFGQAAVDDEALRLAVRGSLRCRVLVDGEARWESPLLEGGDPPARFALEGLAGARELVLEVDAAEQGFAGDRADWLWPVLVRR